MPIKDIKGLKFGRWTVIDLAGRPDKKCNAKWLCKCDCGNESIVLGTSLRAGRSTSCGCFNIERVKETHISHGKCYTAEYFTWQHMKDRCYNPLNKIYPNYGARGIKVCDRWLESFENFFADMGKIPSSKHSLDRYPNNDGNYEPANCSWRTKSEQNRNTRRNNWLEYNGERMVLTDWAKKWGVDYQNIQSLFKHGRSFEFIYNKFENRA